MMDTEAQGHVSTGGPRKYLDGSKKFALSIAAGFTEQFFRFRVYNYFSSNCNLLTITFGFGYVFWIASYQNLAKAEL